MRRYLCLILILSITHAFLIENPKNEVKDTQKSEIEQVPNVDIKDKLTNKIKENLKERFQWTFKAIGKLIKSKITGSLMEKMEKITESLMEKQAMDKATKMAKMFEDKFTGQNKILNNYPGLNLPRPFAAFHPTIIKNRLIHLEHELLEQIKMDKARELETKHQFDQIKNKKPKPRIFTPLNFRIIG